MNGQTVVYGQPLSVEQGQVCGHARQQGLAAKRRNNFTQIAAGNPNDANSTAPGCGGNGGDGVGVARQHAVIFTDAVHARTSDPPKKARGRLAQAFFVDPCAERSRTDGPTTPSILFPPYVLGSWQQN